MNKSAGRLVGESLSARSRGTKRHPGGTSVYRAGSGAGVPETSARSPGVHLHTNTIDFSSFVHSVSCLPSFVKPTVFLCLFSPMSAQHQEHAALKSCVIELWLADILNDCEGCLKVTMEARPDILNATLPATVSLGLRSRAEVFRCPSPSKPPAIQDIDKGPEYPRSTRFHTRA